MLYPRSRGRNENAHKSSWGGAQTGDAMTEDVPFKGDTEMQPASWKTKERARMKKDNGVTKDCAKDDYGTGSKNPLLKSGVKCGKKTTATGHERGSTAGERKKEHYVCWKNQKNKKWTIFGQVQRVTRISAQI